MPSDSFAQFLLPMARLPQEAVVKRDGADVMGSLDPHYIEHYGGAGVFPPVMDMSLCNFMYSSSISQLPPLAHPLDLPRHDASTSLNDGDLGMPMALPNLTMAMDSLPVSSFLPMEPPASNGSDSNANLIPLLCHICPKKPNFSDVSHLLTHISSKSHLAARFKLQLSDDASDKQALVHFDEWAENYGINKLLKNRQDAKEQKKQNNLKRQRAGNEKKTRRSSGPRTEVKPGLGDNVHLQMENNPLSLISWHLHTPHASFNDPYQTPPIKKAESVYPLPESPLDVPFVNGATDVQFAPDIIDSIDGAAGATKLKGIVLPGMDLFDAATPDQKRMRNQKKHESVLKNMTKASESIEQTEYVWDEQFLSICRTRNVYDSPSVDGSPVSKDEEEPVVKKRRARKAAATSNTSQRQTRASTRNLKATKRASTRASRQEIKPEDEIESEDENHDLQSGQTVNGFEHNLSEGMMGGDVFGDPRLSMPEVSDHSMANQSYHIPYRNAMQGLPTNRPMSSMFVKPDCQSPFGFYDKENDRAPFSMQHSGNMSSYFAQPRHNMQSNGLNPLCVQRQDSPGFSYMFSGQPFEPPKPTSTPFQSMNAMDYDSMTSGAQYHTGTAQNQTGAFDI